MDVIVDKLALVPLFAGLSEVHLKRVARACERQFIAPGHVVVAAGSKPDAAFLCLDDVIVCETVGDDGETQHDPVPVGATLVEFAMIVETEAAGHYVAIDHARVIRISRAKLIALLEADSELAAVLGDGLTRRLADMATQMRDAAVPFFVPSSPGALSGAVSGARSEALAVGHDVASGDDAGDAAPEAGASTSEPDLATDSQNARRQA